MVLHLRVGIPFPSPPPAPCPLPVPPACAAVYLPSLASFQNVLRCRVPLRGEARDVVRFVRSATATLSHWYVPSYCLLNAAPRSENAEICVKLTRGTPTGFYTSNCGNTFFGHGAGNARRINGGCINGEILRREEGESRVALRRIFHPRVVESSAFQQCCNG